MKRAIISAAIIALSRSSHAIPPAPSSESQVKEAWQQLVHPPRCDIHLAGVDISTAVHELSRQYGWFPNPDVFSPKTAARLEGLRIDIDMKQVSLAEVLACLCNQSGLKVYERFENLGIFGAIGREETGGRNLACAKDGLMMQLSASRFLGDASSSYSLHAGAISAVPWLTHHDARFNMHALCYPDGTTTTNLGEGQVFRMALAPLVENSGCISSIEGMFQIPLPTRVATKQIILDRVELPYEERALNHLIRIHSVAHSEAGWILSYEYGFFTVGADQPEPDYGHVVVLDINGRCLLGTDGQPGSRGFWADGTVASNESCRTLRATYQVEPHAVTWTYVEESRELAIPCVFTNCRIPDVFWKE